MKEITTIVKRVGNGVTKPHYGTIGSAKFVIKSAATHENTFAVINEIIGYNMAKAFNIELPHYELAKITNTTTIANTNVDNELLTRDSICFCTEYKRSFPLVSFEQIKTISKQELLSIIIFDVLVCNKDRNQGNFLVVLDTIGNTKLLPIDYTHAFHLGIVWDWGQIGHVTRADTSDVSQYLSLSYDTNIFNGLRVSQEDFDLATTDFISKADDINISNIFTLIPLELRRNIPESDILLLEKFLTNRLQDLPIIANQIEKFLKERSVII